MVEASPRRIFANAHTYHINSISVNSDGETYLSADDLRYGIKQLKILYCVKYTTSLKSYKIISMFD